MKTIIFIIYFMNLRTDFTGRYRRLMSCLQCNFGGGLMEAFDENFLKIEEGKESSTYTVYSLITISKTTSAISYLLCQCNVLSNKKKKNLIKCITFLEQSII